MSGVADEIRQEGREEGREEAQEDMAIKLLERGKMTWEEIAEVTEFSLEDIKELAEEIDLMPV